MTSALLSFAACGHQGHDHDSDETQATAGISHGDDDKDGAHNADEIVIPADKAEEYGIKTVTITPEKFHGVLKAGGKVLAASGDESTVVATVAGVVSLSRSFTDGSQIAKGSPLFNISTASLADGDISTRARIAYSNAKTELERAEKLIADKIITEKEYLAAKAEFDRAELAYEAVADISPRGIKITAPSGGFVKECNVKDGDYVEVGQPLMTIAQNRNLYLRAEVAERDYLSVGKIVSAKFRPSYSDNIYDISVLDGRLVSAGTSATATSPFIPVTFEFINTGGVMPGCYAEIYLITGSRDNVISVPVSALVEEQGIFSVFIREDDIHYRKQEVTTGDSDGEYIEIKSGLNAGDNVVAEGAIQVKLASVASSIPAHNHNH